MEIQTLRLKKDGRELKHQGISLKKLKLFSVFIFSLFILHFSLTPVSHASHPLITDDAGTMGKSNAQIEFNFEFSYDKERDNGIKIKETGTEIASFLSYGIADNIDIVLGVPYQWFRIKEDGVLTEKENGLSDVSLEIKWRFYEKDGWGIALKPGIALPTGDEGKGLGTGRATYSMFFITTKELEPWTFHMNLGYIRNENKHDERKDILHASVASEVEIIKNLTAVVNIGAERNPDRESNTHPAFILGGLIYTINENFDIDVGIKKGLNKPETDLALLAGIVIRF